MAAVATAPAGTPARWIVSRGVDLTFVIGSAAVEKPAEDRPAEDKPKPQKDFDQAKQQ